MAKTPVVLGFLGVIFLLQMAAQATMAVWSYYVRFQFEWTELDIGLGATLYGVLLVVSQAGLTGVMIKRFGAKRTAIVGLLIGLPSYLISAFATGSWMIILAIVVGTVAGVTFPAMQQMMSERISEDAQGELQGAVASTMSITSIIGPVIMTGTFGYFADSEGLFFPGAPFLLAALFGYASLALLWRVVSKLTPARQETG